MSCEGWEKVKLYDLATWKNGLAFKDICFSECGVPIIKISELKNGITEQTRFSNDIFEGNVRLNKGDLLFSWSGNPETSIDAFWYDLPDGWLNQHIFKVVAAKNIKKNYLYYILKFNKPRFSAIASNKQTTGLGHVTVKDLKEMEISLPPLPEQKAIAAVLSALDDKIELNNKINKNLEEIAQAIFKSWFVDFEPFQDGEFVESELGMIPNGWRVGTLDELVVVKYGKDHKKLLAGIIPVFGSGGIMRYVERPIYSKESVLIPRKGTLSNVIYIDEPFWSVDTMFYTEMKHANIAKYVFLDVSSRDLASMNAGSAVPSMTTDILNGLKIIIPDYEALENFEQVLSPLFSSIQSNTKENKTLSQLRDTLLPKLISGEIRIPVEVE